MIFPTVTGSNLLHRAVTLPGDLQGEINILFMAFYQWHQALVDSWAPYASKLEQSNPGVRFYETPVIHKMNFLAQTIINEGMRAGIPSPATREKTITLYLDKKELRRSLSIPNEETIWVILLDRQGIRRVVGAFSQEKG